MNIHGSAVAFSDCGVLITGASGSGKSGLAWRLMALGGELVSDDRVILELSDGLLVMRAPDSIRGRIEARGVGIRDVPFAESSYLSLVVDMDRAPEARMPQEQSIEFLGLPVELILGRDVANIDAILAVLLRSTGQTPRAPESR